MNNQQLYLAIGIPSLFALVGIATNITLYVFLAGRIDRKTERTEDKTESVRTDLTNKIENLRTEINGSLKVIGDRLHDDMQNIMGRDREMDKRVMRLEGH